MEVSDNRHLEFSQRREEDIFKGTRIPQSTIMGFKEVPPST